MTEDGKIFDYELDWIPVSSGLDKRILFMNKDRGSLFRIIDMENETYSFSDVERIDRIRDINKVLIKEDNEELNKRRFLPIANRILDEIIPIQMPYMPTTYTCYIENFPDIDPICPDILGICYFWDKTSNEMTEVKRFFRINTFGNLENPKVEEINFNTYNDLKRKWFEMEAKKNVDNDTTKEHNS